MRGSLRVGIYWTIFFAALFCIALYTLIPNSIILWAGIIGLLGHFLLTIIAGITASVKGHGTRWLPMIIMLQYLLLFVSYVVLYVPFIMLTVMIVGDFTGANPWWVFLFSGIYLFVPAITWYVLVRNSLRSIVLT